MKSGTSFYADKNDDEITVQPKSFRLPHPSIPIIAAAATICILGVVAIISPFFFSEVIDVVIGCVMIGAGLTFAFHLFSWPKVGTRILVGLLSLFAILSGLIMLLHPMLGLYALSLTLGIYFLVEGSLKIFGFGRLSGLSYGMQLFSGLMSAILGVLILWVIPIDSTWIVGLLFGVDLLVGGVVLLSIIFTIRSIRKRTLTDPGFATRENESHTGYNTASFHNTPVNNTPVNNTPVNNTPVNSSPVNDGMDQNHGEIHNQTIEGQQPQHGQM